MRTRKGEQEAVEQSQGSRDCKARGGIDRYNGAPLPTRIAAEAIHFTTLHGGNKSLH